MRSFFDPAYREGCFLPVVHAYYDRADMVGTTRREINHAHGLCEIMYVNGGRIAVEAEGTTVALGRGQYIWLDAGVRHQLMIDGATNAGVMNIEFQLEALPPRAPDLAMLCREDAALRALMAAPAPYLVLADEDETVYNLLKQIILLADSTHREAEALCSWLTAQVMLLMARAWKRAQGGEAGDGDARLADALAYIDAHLAEPITAGRIAEAAGMRPAQAGALVRAQCGLSVGEYVTRRRVRRAQALLAETDDTLLDIAMAVGMSSQQRLTQVFRRLTGMSPSEYRRQTQQHDA